MIPSTQEVEKGVSLSSKLVRYYLKKIKRNWQMLEQTAILCSQPLISKSSGCLNRTGLAHSVHPPVPCAGQSPSESPLPLPRVFAFKLLSTKTAHSFCAPRPTWVIRSQQAHEPWCQQSHLHFLRGWSMFVPWASQTGFLGNDHIAFPPLFHSPLTFWLSMGSLFPVALTQRLCSKSYLLHKHTGT